MLLEKELGVIENSYYEASVRRPAVSPPLCGPVQADVCVIGGGYSGLSAALELAQRGYTVVVLEAQRIGWGASGRNGGEVIVGFGSDAEHAIEMQFSRGDARRAWDISVSALDLLRRRIRQHDIDCEYHPGYLSLAVNARKAHALSGWMQHVNHFYDYPLRWIAPDEIGDWIASARFHSAVFDGNSGHLHPLKYCLGLAAAARAAGVSIFENSAVYRVERGSNPVAKTAQGEVACQFMVLAGNVYLDEYGDDIAPEITTRIMPVGTYMIATEPMAEALAAGLIRQRAAASDTNRVLDYFRVSADHRLLFGAGETYTATTPPNLVARMRKRMLAVFPQLETLSIPYAWGGFVDLTLNKAPHFGRIGKTIFYLQGFSGHGVALSGMAGQLVAEAVSGQAERFDILSRIKHLPFPGGKWIRTPALVLGMWYYRLRDAL